MFPFKLSLSEVPIGKLMSWLNSSLMKSYTKGISNTMNHKPPPWNLFLGADGLHCLPKLLSSIESIQWMLKNWYMTFFFLHPRSLLWISTLNSFPLSCKTDEVTRITVNIEPRKTESISWSIMLFTCQFCSCRWQWLLNNFKTVQSQPNWKLIEIWQKPLPDALGPYHTLFICTFFGRFKVS